MDAQEYLNSLQQNTIEELPSLIQTIESQSVAGFDNIEENKHFPSISVPKEAQSEVETLASDKAHHARSASISLPSSPVAAKRVLFSDYASGVNSNGGITTSLSSSTLAKAKLSEHAKFHHSQPMPVLNGNIPTYFELPRQNLPRSDRLKDKRYDSFKTWSGKLERQISNLRGRAQEPEPKNDASTSAEIQSVPVDRYFDALEGPELDTLRASEELLLPEDKQWPFLLRYPISSFGICLGVSSQAILWKTIAISPSTSFLHSGVSTTTPSVSTSSLPHGLL